MTKELNANPALQAGSIGNLNLKNRYVLSPMSRASATEEGVPTQNMADYYTRFACGGFGLIIAEGAFTDMLYSRSYGNQPGMCTHAHEQGWRQIVEAVHEQGCKIILQLIHAGAVSQFVESPHAPSAVQPGGDMLQGYGPKQGRYSIPIELDERDIDDIKSGFLQAAERAANVGFDGVEVHCANGYLLDQFLTPETNQRAAPYGGSLENRIRLTCEIIADINAKCGEGFVTGVRLSQAKSTNPDYFWVGGVKDAEVIFGAVAKAGADFIHFASETKGYAYHSSTKDGVRLTKLAKTVTGLPVIANGGLHDRDLASEVIENEEADLIAIGKAAMVNPDLPKRIEQKQALNEFTYEVFSYGVSVEAQTKWKREKEESITS